MKRYLLPIIVCLLVTVVIFTVSSCGTTPNESTAAESTTKTTVTPNTSNGPNDGTTKPDVSTTKPTTTEKPPVSENKPSGTTAPESTAKAPTTTEPVVTTEPAVTVPEPPKNTPIKVTYVINNPDAGKIAGSAKQTVRYGVSTTTTVQVAPNLGYKFVGWSDGKTTSMRKGDCPRQDTVYTAIFTYDAYALPILDLRTDSGQDITDKYNYQPGTITVANAPEGFNFENLAMEIRGRGNYTWGSTFNADPMYNKRPYRIKLSQKMNLLGQGNGKAKNWVLIANHCDQSLLRNYTVHNFARMLEGIVWQPSAQNVEVFLNGEYIGVYMLSEQVQVNPNRINISEDVESSDKVAFLAHRSGYAFNESDNDSFYYDGQPYEVVSDLSIDPAKKAAQMQYIQERIGECWDAILYGSQEEILELIDINSVIDTMIVHEYFKNLDTGHDNFYMFAEVDGKLFFGPCWDFDQCAGNADVGVENYEGIRGSFENKWYNNLLKHNWYKEMVLARWDELYADEIAKIPDMIRSAAEAGYKSYCRNFEKWKILGYTDEDGNKRLGYKINRELDHIRIFQTYDEHYLYFIEWLEKRAAWLNNYYHSPEFVKQEVKLELKGQGTEASPYLISSAEDFYNFTMVMMNGNSFQNKYLKQTADIDMSTITYYAGIGGGNVFAGTYDGKGHTINLAIKSAGDGCPFPYVTGTVMNVMTTGSIENSGIAAGIARSIRIGGKLVNCGSSCTISSSGAHAGGIAGSNETNGGSIIGCFFIGKITAGQFGPINVYYADRGTGDVNYNIFIESYCDPSAYPNATYREGTETALKNNELSVLHTRLAINYKKVAELSKIDQSKLYTWQSFAK